MSLILALKVIHVIAAIVAVGANVTYALWLNRAKHDPAHLTFALRGIRSLDTFVANPAYVVLGVTGPAMVVAGAFSFTQGWIVASLFLCIVVALLGIAVFAPALRRQAAEAERDPDQRKLRPGGAADHPAGRAHHGSRAADRGADGVEAVLSTAPGRHCPP